MGRRKAALPLLLLLALGVGQARGFPWESDGVALLAQKQAISNWPDFAAANGITGWQDLATVCWEWTGVNCTDDRVTSLTLRCRGADGCSTTAVGALSPDLSNITMLQTLMLNNLSLTGTLPNTWGDPNVFRQLTTLAVNYTNIAGALPASWANPMAFPKLSYLDLGNNQFTGGLPESWGSFTAFKRLARLHLTNAKLSGSLPTSWAAPGTFSSLSRMFLDNNALSGTLPADWGTKTLMNLNTLVLSDNRFVGTLPATWCGPGIFSQLATLHLGQNNLTGTLPGACAQLGALNNLSNLGVSKNDLTGSLPPEWGQTPGFLAYLTKLDVGGNKLKGTLPAQWGSEGAFPALAILSAEGNQLTGTLPPEWGDVSTSAMKNLTELNLSGNNLTGTIPASWGTPGALNLTSGELDLDDTLLCGPVPADLQPTVCTGNSNPCSSEGSLGECPPAAAPAPAAAEEASSSSSVPIGAIVGGVAGGLALCLLAFLALRPGKGWLRRRKVKGQQPGDGKVDSLMGSNPAEANIDSFVTISTDGKVGSSQYASSPPSSAIGPPLLPSSAPPGPSTLTGAGAASAKGGVYPPLLPSTTPPPGGWAPANAGGGPSGSQSISLHSADTDPLLSYIASSLASIQQHHVASTAGATANTSRTSRESQDPSHPAGGGSRHLPDEMQQWEVTWDDIKLLHPIGRGSFGWVYFARWEETPVAAKVLINTDGNFAETSLELPPDMMQRLKEEAAMLSRMRHPNIVSFMGLCTLPPCILTEYCERGSLYDVLQAAAKRPERAAALTWRLRLKMALDAATGLMYLHRRSPPIIHRDVKSPNLLVDHSWCVKVADFNLSKIMGPQQPSVLSTSGGASNPVWLAPEVLEGGRATAASDTYSFGLVLWELLTWRLPWAGMAPLQIMRLATSGQRPECPERGSLPGPGSEEFGGLEEYCQLIRDCWAQRPEERPLFIDVVPRLRGLLESAAEQ